MKLVRYGRAGAEKPGLVGEDGLLRDLSLVVTSRPAHRPASPTV
jgi:hypothetical protein